MALSLVISGEAEGKCCGRDNSIRHIRHGVSRDIGQILLNNVVKFHNRITCAGFSDERERVRKHMGGDASALGKINQFHEADNRNIDTRFAPVSGVRSGRGRIASSAAKR